MLRRTLILLLTAISLPALAQDEPGKSFACQVTPSEKVDLASPVAGVIDKMLVERGDKVTKGQPVVALRSEVERASYSLAQQRAKSDSQIRAKEARLAFEDRRLERNAGLEEKNIISQHDLDQMRTDREIAKAELTAAQEGRKIAQTDMERAKAELDLRTLKSPVNGVVIERRFSAGEAVRDQPLLVISKVDPLHIEVALPVTLFGRVKKGSDAVVTFDTPGIDSRSLKVALADPVIEPTSNTFGVRLVLPNGDGRLPAGAKCHVEFKE